MIRRRLNQLFTILTVASVLTMALGITKVQAQKLYKVKMKNVKQLQKFFTYKADRPVFISGYRSGMSPGYPENCIASCEKTLTLMTSFLN